VALARFFFLAVDSVAAFRLADSECDFEWTFVVFFALDSFLLVWFFQVNIDSSCSCSHNCQNFSSSVLLYGAEHSIRARELRSGAMV
jgi:hypothetical protein